MKKILLFCVWLAIAPCAFCQDTTDTETRYVSLSSDTKSKGWYLLKSKTDVIIDSGHTIHPQKNYTRRKWIDNGQGLTLSQSLVATDSLKATCTRLDSTRSSTKTEGKKGEIKKDFFKHSLYCT